MPDRRPVRRSVALAIGAIAIAAPTLTSCGFHYATDRPYTPAAGFNDRSGSVAISGAVVVATRPGEGTLVASLSNQEPTQEIALQGVNPDANENVTVAQFPQIPIMARGVADLAEDRIGVTGDYTAGDVLSLSFVFSDGTTKTMDVAVVTNCDEFKGYDTAFADAPATPSASPSKAGAGQTPEETPSAEPTDSSTAEPFDCAFPTVPPLDSGEGEG